MLPTTRCTLALPPRHLRSPPPRTQSVCPQRDPLPPNTLRNHPNPNHPCCLQEQGRVCLPSRRSSIPLPSTLLHTDSADHAGTEEQVHQRDRPHRRQQTTHHRGQHLRPSHTRQRSSTELC
ncbi:hypothetical protein BLNAU_6417 [Blattamonas nauphoetae]|uniref:Uncharacterized protein n=1 Tax=Blattamonas nauphoetae TaxID=2049346 RepID=A0ABQ9Y4I0_9EUKA|nr:hypothetical protein BLNAU_6417 [Blattamonas nauphoetae]